MKRSTPGFVSKEEPIVSSVYPKSQRPGDLNSPEGASTPPTTTPTYHRVVGAHPTAVTTLSATRVVNSNGALVIEGSSAVDRGMQSTVHNLSFNTSVTMPGVTSTTPTAGQAPVPIQTHTVRQPTPPPPMHQMTGTQQPTSNVVPQLTDQQAQAQNFQRLRVEDALSYLDQVKYKFGNQPQVYNDFLDIMKEFKSQSIDTPGVIARVSNLFKGHPELIVGFNTFLPPGYKIEVQANESVSVSAPGQPTTVVHGPTGVITFPQGPPTTSAPTAALSSNVNTNSNTAGVVAKPSLTSHQPTSNSATAHHSYNQPPPQPSTNPPVGSQSPSSHTAASQPVEFNHAINYVNKIKNRFQGQPDIYKRFLEILHTYQKEQRIVKEGIPTGKTLTEGEVFSQVAKLFKDQEDLLQEFGQFLPDATKNMSTTDMVNAMLSQQTHKGVTNDHTSIARKPIVKSGFGSSSSGSKYGSQLKRPAVSSSLQSPVKKPRMFSMKDFSLSEAGKHATLTEYAFFDKVRKALRSQEAYENFLRCLVLYIQEVISSLELVQLASPFLGKFPDLFKWFKEFLGYRDTNRIQVETISNNVAKQERVSGDLAMDIDYSTCKRLGASYCALPKNYIQPKCSGRTQLCKEVLNDTWVSFPSWSEDSTFVSSRKTQYEEYIYRCEDERFELDVVIETNAATIQALEAVRKRLDRMAPEEAARFKLDDCLGGSSPTVHQRAIRRIYGDKAPDIIEGLKKNPVLAVPLVLRRMKDKEEEWREAQKSFNKIWREQNEKFYLKSLDYQGITFKQNDVKFLRSKSLINEIETIYDERHEQAEERGEVPQGPHLTLSYCDRSVLDDATDLMIHHVKRQVGMHKEEKRKVKQLLRQFVPDLFFHPRQELSEDEREDDDCEEEEECEDKNDSKHTQSSLKNCSNNSSEKRTKKNILNGDVRKEVGATLLYEMTMGTQEEQYSLFFGNNNWFLFLRLYQILCERLSHMYEQAVNLAKEELQQKRDRKESTSVALRLKPKNEIEISDYYPAFLDMVKSVLDGNMENTVYEDTLRDMFGIHAYLSFTLDKVVINAVRQLQHLVTEEPCIQCMEIFQEEWSRNAAGGQFSTRHQRTDMEAAYQKRMEQVLADENCFKILIYKVDNTITFELIDTETDDASGSDQAAEAQKLSSYVENYINPGEGVSEELEPHLSQKPVFLSRNLRLRQEAWETSSGGTIPGDILSTELMLEKMEESGENKEEKVELNAAEITEEKAASPIPPKTVIPEDLTKEKERPTSRSSDHRRQKSRSPQHIVHYDKTQCKFNINSYKKVYLMNSENLLYKRLSLKKAKLSHKNVSDRMNKKFRLWHKQWSGNHVTDTQQRTCTDWLVGQGDGMYPNRTRVITSSDHSKPPYSTYNRYKVEWIRRS